MSWAVIGVHHGCGMSWTPQTPAYAINNSIYFRSIVSLDRLSGWWYTYPSEKYESQLGWLFPIDGKIKNVPNHRPVIHRYEGDVNPDTPFFFRINGLAGHLTPTRKVRRLRLTRWHSQQLDCCWRVKNNNNVYCKTPQQFSNPCISTLFFLSCMFFSP